MSNIRWYQLAPPFFFLLDLCIAPSVIDHLFLYVVFLFRIQTTIKQDLHTLHSVAPYVCIATVDYFSCDHTQYGLAIAIHWPHVSLAKE